MLRKSKRLTRADFTKIDMRSREHGSFFTLSASPSPVGLKFACVVSKKTAPKANDRNLIKRRCRAAFREINPSGPIAFVFTAKRTAGEAVYKDVLADVKKLVVKAEAGLSA